MKKAQIEKELKELRDGLPYVPEEHKSSVEKTIADLEKQLAEKLSKAAKPAVEKIVKRAGSRTEEISRRSNETEIIKLLFDSAKQQYIITVENKRSGNIDSKPVTGDMIKVATTYISRLKARMDAKEISTGTFTVWLAEQGGEKIYNHVRDFATKKQIAFPTFSHSGFEESDQERRNREAREVSDKIQKENNSGKSSVADWDCDELIEKEKAKLKKRKAASKKRDKKTEKTKNNERVDKVVEIVEEGIRERIDKGKPVTKAEVQGLIRRYEEAITDLKKILKTL